MGITDKDIYKENEIWILNNLSRYGNCLIPKSIIKQLGVEETIKRLSNDINKSISIKEVVIDNVSSSPNPKNRKKNSIDYVAEVAH